MSDNMPLGAVRNKHPARCHKCRQWFGAGNGFVFRELGRWIGEHDECPEMDDYGDDDSPWHGLYSSIHDGG